MTGERNSISLEDQIDQWRNYLKHRQAIHSGDVAELEDHLREQIDMLTEAGLARDEAFLVAVKRMGNLDALSREFAREHSERLWKQLVVPSIDSDAPQAVQKDARFAVGLAFVAALLVEVPMAFGVTMETHSDFYFRNASLFALPVLATYFGWKRRIDAVMMRWLAVAFVAAAVVANAYPFMKEGSTETLSFIHMPIALWMMVGIAYTGSRWKQTEGRMDLIRFTGEWFIYYALIALGGGVLMGFMALIFEAIGIRIEYFFQMLVPMGAAGAVIIASWLVETKQSVIENMAPVLARLFTPLFTAVLITFLGALGWTTAHGHAIDRNMLVAFDGLLIVVLALLLYSISARDPRRMAGVYDVMQVVLVVCALLADAVALWAIAARITEFGFSANRVAVLGINVMLLVNLAWSAVLYMRFLRKSGTFTALEKWQTDYLPVYAIWAAIIVLVFPPLFGFK